jgi:hypothetical protein
LVGSSVSTVGVAVVLVVPVAGAALDFFLPVGLLDPVGKTGTLAH